MTLSRVPAGCSAMEKWVKGKLNNCFIFLLNYFPRPYLIIFQSGAHCTEDALEVCKINIYGMNIAKNEEKHYSTWRCLQPIFWLILGSTYPKIGFRVSVPPLVSTFLMLLQLYFLTPDGA